MKLNRLFRSACICLFTISISPCINAATITAFDIDNDAQLTLAIEDTLTIGVDQKWGTVHISVEEFDVALNTGDMVDIMLFEDDVIADDLLWNISFFVTPSEASAGFVSRTFELIFSPSPDDNNNAEIFAEARINKSACIAFCINDNPLTQNLNVALVNPVPVPAAVWLFGTGLLGLIGVARRKKA